MLCTSGSNCVHTIAKVRGYDQCVFIVYRCDREMSVDESEPEKVVQVLALDALLADTHRW